MTTLPIAAGRMPPHLFERVRLFVASPDGYVHSAAFHEWMAALAAAFSALGTQVDTSTDTLLIGEGVNLVFGAHLFAPEVLLPANCVLVNLEQFPDSIMAREAHYLALLKRHPVLDYSPHNAERVRQAIGHSWVHVLRIGYMPALTRIDRAAQEDVDVLFYGTVNERRQAIIDALASTGLRLKVLNGVYGAERDAWIARSKVVLNMHYYESKVHEVIRTSYLLANRKAVVSECAADTEIDDDLRAAVVAVPYEQIASACRELVLDEPRRAEIEKNGFELFARRDQVAILAELLPRLSRPLPRRINLGSGKAFDADRLNIDIDPKWHPDIVGDIAGPHGLNQVFFSRRFGFVRLQPGGFDEITVMDVLEHVPDLVLFMTRCLELLTDGGSMRIGVPYDLSWGAWQDPTHVRAFNERSWLYYTDWHWYLGWQQARFDTTELQMVLSTLGQELQQRGIGIDEICRTPRAVDSMQVLLTKRALTDAEREQATQWLAGATGNTAALPKDKS